MNQSNDEIFKILVIRNDKLGDFMLTLPAFALLKSVLPNSEIYALVPEYTKDIAMACPWIDGIIVDPGKKSGRGKFAEMVKAIKNKKFNSAVTLFSTTRIGLAVFMARIPHRFAPATKIAQIFHNHRLTQRRSKSEKPEYAYNMDLAEYCLNYYNILPDSAPKPPFLSFDSDEIKELKTSFCREYNLDEAKKIIFLHPGSGGSANNLSPQQYAQLADLLRSNTGHSIVVSAGPGEIKTAQTVARLIKSAPYVIYESKQGLLPFAKHIQFANLFISGSTGPLHIAGALDTPTAGFYTRRRSATALRWQTLNSPAKRLAFSPPEDAEELDMGSIDLPGCAKTISDKFLND